MRKKLWLYLIAIAAVLAVLVLFNREYRSLTGYSELAARHNLVYNSYQNLSTQITNAAVLNPNLLKAIDSTKTRNIFFTDSTEIIRQLNMLRSAVRDTENIKIAANLDKTIRTELSWLLNSNLPDSIINHRSPAHIAAFERIDSLIKQGILRTIFLIEERKKQLSNEADKLKLWITLFVIISGCLLMYVTFGLFRQQSQRKKKEQELESVFNRINDSVVSVDTCWRYTFLNDTALATHPLGKAETIGRSIWDVHPEMKGTIFWDKYHEAMITRKVMEIEDYYAPMDTWFSVKVYPSADGLTIFYKDITHHKKAEQELLQTLREVSDYKFALDESSIVAITDQKGIIKHANQNFCNISKYSVEELIGQDHRIINSGYHSKEFIKELWATIGSGKIWKGELKNKAKDGTIYWVDTTIVPFLDEKAKPYQYVAISADITQRKQTEEEIKMLNEELEKRVNERTEELVIANRDLRIAGEQFKEVNKELESFSYSVSHDLRAPLRAVHGYTEMLKANLETQPDPEAHRLMNNIMSNAKKMGQLIDDLLNFARIGRKELVKTNLQMQPVVTEICNGLKNEQGDRNIEYLIGELLPAQADSITIRHVWQNLISNAIKYSQFKDKSVIEIGSEIKGNEIIYHIKDNGAGFDMRYAGKLFGVFQRLHSDEEFEGTGVGLALVQRIIVKHGGRIWAEGQVNKGATFFFTLNSIAQ